MTALAASMSDFVKVDGRKTKPRMTRPAAGSGTYDKRDQSVFANVTGREDREREAIVFTEPTP